ncbi:MAG: YqgE/AlgH family protein [Roseinatronobacter sp.]
MSSLTGKLLIATPAMPDPRFAHAVIYLCAHSKDGAMGLIVNRPLPDMTLGGLVKHLDLPQGQANAGLGLSEAGLDGPVHFGGPVETGRGFVLHSPDYFAHDGSVQVSSTIVLTTSRDILADMGRGQGPHRAITALGYSGWGAGQLEGELHAGGWLLAEGDARLVFDTPDPAKWVGALDGLGVDPKMLSATTGHA